MGLANNAEKSNRKLTTKNKKLSNGLIQSKPPLDGKRGKRFDYRMLRCTRKKHRLCRCFFQLNPPLRVGEIACCDEIQLRWVKFAVSSEWVDLISSVAKPKISSALADFTLASARISFMQGFEFIRKTAQNVFFVVH